MRLSHCILLLSVHLGAHVQARVMRRQEEASGSLSPSATGSSTPTATGSVPTPSAAVGQDDVSQRSRTLLESVVNPGFADDGMEGAGADIIPSETSTNNWINFCATVPLPNTNGGQIKEGSCSSVPAGVIPASNKMPSTKITSPANGAVIAPKTQFTVSLTTRNFATGFATNPQKTYMSAPQTLDQNGHIRGHLHIVIEQIISPNQTDAPDPTYFAYFKGINTAAEDNKLKTDVPGLPAGEYRVCTLTSNANHAALALPIAQRGSSEDCVYFKIADSGSGSNSATTTWGASLFGVTLASLLVPVYLLF